MQCFDGMQNAGYAGDFGLDVSTHTHTHTHIHFVLRS